MVHKLYLICEVNCIKYKKMKIIRQLQQHIEKQLFRGKTIILYGARRVGKTYLSKQILAKHSNSLYVNCELLQYKTALETTNSELLYNFLGKYKLVVLDEAQHIANIGLILKIISDTFPKIQIIATGSSSFDLAGQITEPLTGRSREYLLLPLSFAEIAQQHDLPTMLVKISQLMRFGSYPEVFSQSETDAKEEIMKIASNYLYKDILQFERIRKPDLILNLLRALTLQLGSEVSYNELANTMGQNVHTIKRYIELLEKNFVIFRLKSFSRNPRKEIAKGQKIYFYDLGIANALLNNFNLPELRSDKGGLWENFCVAERLKYNINNRRFVNSYFLRTYSQHEIDYIEEADGQLNFYEFKYNPNKKARIAKSIIERYPDAKYETINNRNIYQFLD